MKRSITFIQTAMQSALTVNGEERWTLGCVHAVHDQWSETFVKSCSHLKIEIITV
jgi:hypothetical protein